MRPGEGVAGSGAVHGHDVLEAFGDLGQPGRFRRPSPPRRASLHDHPRAPGPGQGDGLAEVFHPGETQELLLVGQEKVGQAGTFDHLVGVPVDGAEVEIHGYLGPQGTGLVQESGHPVIGVEVAPRRPFRCAGSPASARFSGTHLRGAGGMWLTKARSPLKLRTTVIPATGPLTRCEGERSTPSRRDCSTTNLEPRSSPSTVAKPAEAPARLASTAMVMAPPQREGEGVDVDLLAGQRELVEVPEHDLQEDRPERDQVHSELRPSWLAVPSARQQLGPGRSVPMARGR